MSEPKILHLSFRLAGLPNDTRFRMLPAADKLGVAVYFIYGEEGKPATQKEYGMALTITRAEIDDLLASRELVIKEVYPPDALREGEAIREYPVPVKEIKIP